MQRSTQIQYGDLCHNIDLAISNNQQLAASNQLPMDNIYSAILEAQVSGQSAALCTVIRSSGSVPRHSTSKMLVFADGKFVGTVGGGGMEQRTIEEAKAVARSGQSKIVEYNLVDPKQGDPGVCGGTVEIFIEPINPPPSVI